MEASKKNSPNIGKSVDSRAKYISGLSTILEATILEAKDRILQIEYVFCSQLYPTFQSNCNSKITAEDAWKEEGNLLNRIGKNEHELHQAVEENCLLKLEREKSLKEQEERMSLLLAQVKGQQIKIDRLEKELLYKSKEVDEGMELQNKLIQMIQSKDTEIMKKCKQLKEHDEKTKALPANLRQLQEMVDNVQEELKKRTEEVEKGKELRGRLLQNIEAQVIEIRNKDQLLNDGEEEKKQLMDKLKILKNFHKLQNELKKDEETSKCEGYEKEKRQILAKLNNFEEKVNELHQQIEFKSSELELEKKKSRDIVNAHKRLKSQLILVCKRFGLSTEGIFQNKLEDGTPSLWNQQDQKASTAGWNGNTVENDITASNDLEDKKQVGALQISGFHPPTFGSHTVTKFPDNVKSISVARTKRPAPSWRDTRSAKCNVGHDPHDDFLNTPFENIKNELNNKASNDDVHDHQIPVSKDINFGGSDDETRDLNVEPLPQQRPKPLPKSGQRDFKYVEPIRKKSKREDLKGIECKQCKKFYDAVCPKKDADGSKLDLHCEDHEGVSRHRYRDPTL